MGIWKYHQPTNVFTNILTGVVARVVLEMLAHLKMILIKIKNKDARCRCSSVNNKTGKQELRQNFEFVLSFNAFAIKDTILLKLTWKEKGLNENTKDTNLLEAIEETICFQIRQKL